VSDKQYRRIVGVNVDGVVFGVRRLSRVMRGGSIVVTASLAGLTAMENDPLYALTKHALVGFVRSVAPQLAERGIRLNMVNPGIVDTPLLGDEGREALEAAGFPLLRADEVAAAVLRAAADEEVGQAWVVQPGREPLKFRFPGVPGPRVPGKEGMVPRL
jgi:NAD(P)-dependent dehydrogenase (short-subunit alcohol dehydrogenase family)